MQGIGGTESERGSFSQGSRTFHYFGKPGNFIKHCRLREQKEVLGGRIWTASNNTHI